MPEELKPCPWCLCRRTSYGITEDRDGCVNTYRRVCKSCAAEGPISHTRKLADAAWNRRAPIKIRTTLECPDEYLQRVADMMRADLWEVTGFDRDVSDVTEPGNIWRHFKPGPYARVTGEKIVRNPAPSLPELPSTEGEPE